MPFFRKKILIFVIPCALVFTLVGLFWVFAPFFCGVSETILKRCAQFLGLSGKTKTE
jgi:membrane associated rhomboid family serine protease